MAAWAELTQEQRDIYSTFEKDLRALSGEFQRWANKAEALNTRYNAQMQAILVALDDGTIVPNSSGLAGSSSLNSDADMVSLVSYIQGTLTSYNTAGHKEKRAMAAGQQNV